jgi:hypothetical protein
MRDTQRKGDIAKAQAISTFTKLGWDVLTPITESAPYDLVVDTGKELKKISVKYMGGTQVDLRNIHTNKNGYVVKKNKENDYDWLYIYSPIGKEYLIKECLSGRSTVNPNSSQEI